MFAMKIALLHARKTAKTQIFKRWFTANGKKFFSKRWFIKRRKRKFFKCWFAINVRNAWRHAVALSNLYWKASPLQVSKDNTTGKKMFVLKIALLHARKTAKTQISKMLICNQRRNRQFFKRWYATNGKKFLSKRWFIKKLKTSIFPIPAWEKACKTTLTKTAVLNSAVFALHFSFLFFVCRWRCFLP